MTVSFFLVTSTTPFCGLKRSLDTSFLPEPLPSTPCSSMRPSLRGYRGTTGFYPASISSLVCGGFGWASSGVPTLGPFPVLLDNPVRSFFFPGACFYAAYEYFVIFGSFPLSVAQGSIASYLLQTHTSIVDHQSSVPLSRVLSQDVAETPPPTPPKRASPGNLPPTMVPPVHDAEHGLLPGTLYVDHQYRDVHLKAIRHGMVMAWSA